MPIAELASTNRSQHAYVRETTPGETPANPAFKRMRVTGSPDLQFSPQTVVSDEIRSDRQVADLILVGIQAGGTINMEVSFEAQADMVEAALQGTWDNLPSIVNATADTEISDVSVTTLTVASGGAAFVTGMLCLMSGFGTPANNKLARVASSGATTIVFPASTFTAEAVVPAGARVRAVGFEGAAGDLVAVTSGGNGLTSTVLNFTTLGLALGQWLFIGEDGLTSSAFNFATAPRGWARISGIAANRLFFDRVPNGWQADAGAGKTIRIYTGDIVTNASTKRYFTIERQQLDTAVTQYEYYRGMLPNTLSYNLQAQRIATSSIGFVGADAVSSPGTRIAGATDIAPPAYDVLNTSSNVGRVGLNGSVVTGPNFVMEASLEINNNAERQMAFGSIGAVGIRAGEFNVSGRLNTYFGDDSILAATIANSVSSFDFRLGRADGNRETLLFDLPKIKFSQANAPVSGKNADRMVEGSFQAMVSAFGYTVGCMRFWYLPVVATTIA